jgi:hypothetical protein
LFTLYAIAGEFIEAMDEYQGGQSHPANDDRMKSAKCESKATSSD